MLRSSDGRIRDWAVGGRGEDRGFSRASPSRHSEVGHHAGNAITGRTVRAQSWGLKGPGHMRSAAGLSRLRNRGLVSRFAIEW